MKIIQTFVHSTAVLSLGLILCLGQAAAADANAAVPAVIQNGFAFFAKGQPELAVDLWRKGGLMQGEYRNVPNASYFKEADMTIGSYKSLELIQTKAIGSSSQIFYLAINYERGAIYARFLLYRTDKDWVVQNMEFNTKPEAVMPWLALEASN